MPERVPHAGDASFALSEIARRCYTLSMWKDTTEGNLGCNKRVVSRPHPKLYTAMWKDTAMRASMRADLPYWKLRQLQADCQHSVQMWPHILQVGLPSRQDRGTSVHARLQDLAELWPPCLRREMLHWRAQGFRAPKHQAQTEASALCTQAHR